MTRSRGLLSLFLILLLLLSIPVSASAELPKTYSLNLQIGEDRQVSVWAIDESYENNIYLSLTDLSAALNGTAKQFRLEYHNNQSDGEYYAITTGQSSSAPLKEAVASPVKAAPSPLALSRKRLFFNGTDRRYYTYQAGTDLFMSLADIQLMLNLSVTYVSPTFLKIDPDGSFRANLEELRNAGYFDVFSGIVVGDADTGDIFFSQNGSRSVPIASTSKLMSYLLIMEAVQAGQIHLTDTVPISAAAAALSRSPDGIVTLYEGGTVPLEELLDAMLLASSNESALALAEYVSGSEEAFVAAMNQRAHDLGLRSALFYTCNGLPVYSASALPIKQQNSMCPLDMFTLVQYILRNFPQITGISSQLFDRMPTLDYTTANSNPLVFNLPGVNGLKTGSTNRAGYCLVASMPVTSGGETHTIVMALFGSEAADVRGQASEILLRTAADYYSQLGFSGGNS